MTIAGKAKTVTAVVHAFLWSLFALLILTFVFSHTARKHVATMAKEANLKSIGEKGLEFGTVEEKSLQLVQENTQLRIKQNPPPLNQDLTPDAAAAALLIALQKANPEPEKEESFWVYVGEYNEQKRAFRNSPNFDLKEPPALGTRIAAVQDVYKRNARPSQDAKRDWHLGSIIGVLPRGTAVTVLETAKIEGENQYDYNSWVRARSGD